MCTYRFGDSAKAVDSTRRSLWVATALSSHAGGSPMSSWNTAADDSPLGYGDCVNGFTLQTELGSEPLRNHSGNATRRDGANALRVLTLGTSPAAGTAATKRAPIRERFEPQPARRHDQREGTHALIAAHTAAYARRCVEAAASKERRRFAKSKRGHFRLCPAANAFESAPERSTGASFARRAFERSVSCRNHVAVAKSSRTLRTRFEVMF